MRSALLPAQAADINSLTILDAVASILQTAPWGILE